MAMSYFLLSVSLPLLASIYFVAPKYLGHATDSNLAARKMKHIVIVGGSFAGVSTAHRILQQAAKTATAPFHITLVSRDRDLYWNIAAPRGIIAGQIPDTKLFQPIAAGFAHYPPGRFEFVLGSATGLDVAFKQLSVSEPNGHEIKLPYDFLILATGSSTKTATPFKSLGSTEATQAALHDYQARISNAKTIVVVGAGPTGVETAGEVAFEYSRAKQIVLVSSGPRVLDGPGRPLGVSATADRALRALGVDVKLNTKVTDERELPDSRTEIAFSSGDKIVADMCIQTSGVAPNSSYVPAEFRDANGFVKVDEFFRVPGTDGVFAIGDVANAEPPQAIFVRNQSKHLARNLIRALSDQPPLPYKVSTSPIIGVQIGKKAGTGHFGRFKLPGFLVVMLRKTLMVEKLPHTVDGSEL